MEEVSGVEGASRLGRGGCGEGVREGMEGRERVEKEAGRVWVLLGTACVIYDYLFVLVLCLSCLLFC